MKLVIYANLTVIVYVAPVELLLMHHNASTTYVVTRHHICGKNHRNIDTSFVSLEANPSHRTKTKTEIKFVFVFVSKKLDHQAV